MASDPAAVLSPPKKALLPKLLCIPGGDGKTSVSLDGGSFVVLAFQMPCPHGKDEDAVVTRPAAILEITGACEPQVPESADGVAGWDVAGDIELPANEFLRG